MSRSLLTFKTAHLLAAGALASVLAAGEVFAVHDNGLFELDVVMGDGDGNTVNDPAVAGEDWEDVYNGTSSAFATAFIVDTFAKNPIVGYPTPENSFFTGGGSKDERCLQDPCETDSGLGTGGPWLYDTTNSQIQDKSDIVTAFAAAYDEPTSGDTIFYFGLDTYDVQGNSNAGFWFYRQPVSLGQEPNFVGEHTLGDIFVAVAYTGGGKIGGIKVYKWGAFDLPNGDPTEGLVLVTEEGADCADVASGDDVCGVVNSTSGEDPPWRYLNKDDDEVYQVPAFVEFGLNASALFDGEIGCFSTFLAETRSSQSTDAQLSDFALGEFPVCGIDVVKEVDALAKVGDDVTYEITIENTGRATLYKQSIIDTLNTTPDPTETVLTDDPGCDASLAPGDTCTISYTRTVLATDPDSLENTVNIVYTEFATYGLEFTAEYTGTTDLFQPDIALDKTVKDVNLDPPDDFVDGPITVLQGATVNYKAVLTDKSSDDTPDLNCTTTDANLPALGGTGIPLTKTAQQVFSDPAGLSWCTLNDGTGNYDCKNTVETACTISDFCEDPQNPTSETCLSFDNLLEDNDMVTVSVVPADVALTVSKECDDFSKSAPFGGVDENGEPVTQGDIVNCEVEITNESNIDLTLDSIVDQNGVPETRDLTDPNVYETSTCTETLAVDASCTITYSRETLVTDPEVINNEVTVEFSDAFGGTGSQSDTDSVDIIHPEYSVNKECIPPGEFPVPSGTFVNFRIDTENTGDADLVLTSVDDSLLGELLAPAEQSLPVVADPPCTDDNFASGVDGCYRIEKSYEVTEDVTNTAEVYAKLAATYDLPNIYKESDGAECDVEEGLFSCTWGFWKTHGSDGMEFYPPVDLGYTCYVAETYVGFPILLGWTDLQDCSDVFGLFWESKAQCSTLEQTRLQASRQFLAAILNDAKFGTPIPAECQKGKRYNGWTNEELFDLMREALASEDKKLIKSLGSIFACYNEYYPCGPIMDDVPIPHADPTGTRAVANFDLVSCGK